MSRPLTSDDIIFIVSLCAVAYGVIESIQLMIRDYCRRAKMKRTAK
ncbi:hypothetical protein EDF84_11190 [Erwinia rhapontici]|nr:hypothetical protein EDF84_11190 [Erwinia rhapontici]